MTIPFRIQTRGKIPKIIQTSPHVFPIKIIFIHHEILRIPNAVIRPQSTTVVEVWARNNGEVIPRSITMILIVNYVSVKIFSSRNKTGMLRVNISLKNTQCLQNMTEQNQDGFLGGRSI